MNKVIGSLVVALAMSMFVLVGPVAADPPSGKEARIVGPVCTDNGKTAYRFKFHNTHGHAQWYKVVIGYWSDNSTESVAWRLRPGERWTVSFRIKYLDAIDYTMVRGRRGGTVLKWGSKFGVPCS